MLEDRPQGDGVPLSATEMLDTFLKAGRQFLAGRMPEEIEKLTGVAASEYKLVDRRVRVDMAKCHKGHDHKVILLIETFNKAAEGAESAEPAEPALTLDEAIDQFRAEALTEPAGALGHAEPTQAIVGARPLPDGSVQKLLVLQQAFETELSLVGNPGQMSPDMAAYMQFMQRRRLGGGGGGVPPPAND